MRTQHEQIEDYKINFRNMETWILLQVADLTANKIKFLESIYTAGGKNNHYSQAFQDAAYRERQALCLVSSAMKSIIRERDEPCAP